MEHTRADDGTTWTRTALAVEAVDDLPIEWQSLAFDLLFADTALGNAHGYRGPADAGRVRERVLARSA